MLFALNFAKDEISKSRSAILVEGYMDVIGLSQNGVGNAVAPLGTSLTESQLAVLKRFADSVYFIFDGDEAGITAANRAIDIAVSSGLEQWTVILPGRMDPYDFAMQHGGDAFRKYMEEKRLSPIDFKLKYFARNEGLKKDKVKYLAAVFPYIKRVESSVRREEYLKKLTDTVQEDARVVWTEYQNFLRNDKSFGRVIGDNSESRKILPKLESEYISYLLLFRDKVSEASAVAGEDTLELQESRDILNILCNDSEKSTREIIAGIPEDSPLLKVLAKLAQDETLKPDRIFELAYQVRLGFLRRSMAGTEDIREKMDWKHESLEIEGILQKFDFSD